MILQSFFDFHEDLLPSPFLGQSGVECSLPSRFFIDDNHSIKLFPYNLVGGVLTWGSKSLGLMICSDVYSLRDLTMVT